MHHITQPSKEQVRAYMHRREVDHRPPPGPDEIRRELGWSSARPFDPFPSAMPAPCSAQGLLFPIEIVRLSTLLAVEWLFRANGYPSNPRSPRQRHASVEFWHILLFCGIL